jgi:hypothetical protein
MAFGNNLIITSWRYHFQSLDHLWTVQATFMIRHVARNRFRVQRLRDGDMASGDRHGDARRPDGEIPADAKHYQPLAVLRNA